MSPFDSPDRLTLFAIGLLVLLAPVVILALTLSRRSRPSASGLDPEGEGRKPR